MVNNKRFQTLIILTIVIILSGMCHAQDFEEYKENLASWKGTDTQTSTIEPVLLEDTHSKLNITSLILPIIIFATLITGAIILNLYKKKIQAKIQELKDKFTEEVKEDKKKSKKKKKNTEEVNIRFKSGVNISKVTSKLLTTIIGLYVGSYFLQTLGNTMNGTSSEFYQGLKLIGWQVDETNTITGTSSASILAAIGMIMIASVSLEFIDIRI